MSTGARPSSAVPSVAAPGATHGIHTVLATTRRPPAPGALSACLTLGWRAVLKIKHVPFQLVDVTAFPIMNTLVFALFFGGAIAGSPGEYIQFLLPGVLVQAIVFITVYTGVGLNTDIQKGLFDRFRSLPIWQAAPIVGALLGDLLRYSIAGLVTLALGFALGFRPEGGVLGIGLAVALLLVFAFAVSWIFILAGLMAETPESVMTANFLIIFPLTFASSIFVDPATMPGWLQAIVAFNPVTHLADAVRGLMHGDPSPGNIARVLLASAAILAVFGPLSMRMYRKER